MRPLRSQLARFGIVGLAGFVIDVGIFNLLRLTVLDEGPLLAKVIATSTAIVVTWIANRHFTFPGNRRTDWAREALEYTIVSLGGLAIGLGCLWVSHYLLGYTSVLADNIASNVIGLVLGTVFRFTLYRVWVFRGAVGQLDVATPVTREPVSSY